MLKLALCEDESIQRSIAAVLLHDYLRDRPAVKGKVFEFSSGPELLESLKTEGRFDLYLLDVVMPEMTGIELGLQLRGQDEEAVIIYLTVSPEYAISAYETQAFGYLVKPVERDRLYQVLDRAIESMGKRKGACVSVKTRGDDRQRDAAGRFSGGGGSHAGGSPIRSVRSQFRGKSVLCRRGGERFFAPEHRRAGAAAPGKRRRGQAPLVGVLVPRQGGRRSVSQGSFARGCREETSGTMPPGREAVCGIHWNFWEILFNMRVASPAVPVFRGWKQEETSAAAGPFRRCPPAFLSIGGYLKPLY